MVLFLWLVWILAFLLNVVQPIHDYDRHLVKVIILFRHGARTPLSSYKFLGTSDNDENSRSENYGQLTRLGKKQLFELGKKLRRRYRDFLVPHNDSVRVEAQAVTTEPQRCYESAGLLLAGLYPPNTERTWSEKLNWQPVSIGFDSPDRIKIIGNRHLCPAYYNDLEAVKTEANHSDSDIYHLLNFFSRHVTSTKVKDLADLFYLLDYFITKETAPEWIPKDIYSKMRRFYVDSYNYLTSTFRMRRLLVGLLIKDIVLRIDEVVYKRKSNSKFFLYSGHDSSLHSLGRTIGFHFESVPYYGACIVFEIHQLSTNDFRIKLLYSPDYSLEKLDVWVLPGCEVLCPVKRFIEFTEPYIPLNWREECTDATSNEL